MTGSGVSPTQLEAAARAVCEASPSSALFPWDELDERDRDSWRRLAKAAIDALNLTEEWGAQRDGKEVITGLHDPLTESDARQLASVYRRAEPVHRYVSPWAVSVLVEENPQ